MNLNFGRLRVSESMPPAVNRALQSQDVQVLIDDVGKLTGKDVFALHDTGDPIHPNSVDIFATPPDIEEVDPDYDKLKVPVLSSIQPLNNRVVENRVKTIIQAMLPQKTR